MVPRVVWLSQAEWSPPREAGERIEGGNQCVARMQRPAEADNRKDEISRSGNRLRHQDEGRTWNLDGRREGHR